MEGFEGQEAVTIQRQEDTEITARAGTIPMCDDAGVAGGGLPADVGGSAGAGAEAEAPESRRRAGPGAGGAAGYRHFKLPPRAVAEGQSWRQGRRRRYQRALTNRGRRSSPGTRGRGSGGARASTQGMGIPRML